MFLISGLWQVWARSGQKEHVSIPGYKNRNQSHQNNVILVLHVRGFNLQ